jgi:hypothetical protein
MSNGKLDSPNLDDRKWKDIVDEAKALIPKYAPEWTDHNPSDLGITLIELFAWIVEGMIYRLNRVPEKNFIEFLNLLGITRDPAAPASTFLTYRLAPGTPPTKVDKGSLAATQQTEKEEGIIFETDADLRVLPINLKNALFIRKVDDKIEYQNVTANLTGSPLSRMSFSIPATGSIITLLGFDSKTTEDISLLFGFDKPVKKDKKGNIPIEITWLYPKDTSEPMLTGGTWLDISKVADGTNVSRVNDGTNMFQKNGSVSLKVPGDWAKQNPNDWNSVPPESEIRKIDQALFWIGLKMSNSQSDELNIVLQYILFNSVSATNAITITQPEFLGISNGKRFQSFELKNRPLFKRPGAKNPYDHLEIEIREPQVGGGFGPWDTWILRDDFDKGHGNYFRLDPVTGTISFGNHDPATSPEGHGTIPPVDSEIRARKYRYVVGGTKSNVPSNKINSIRAPIPGVISVTNPGAAKGGLEEEDIEETKRRGPEILRNRYRAVTAEDYEYLAREVTTAVKKVRCLPPRLFTQYDGPVGGANKGKPWTFGGLNRSTGNIYVIIIPDAPLSDRTPMPSEELLQEVSDYLDERRAVTSKLCVTYPRYLPIRVTVNVNVWQKAVHDQLTPDPNQSDYLKNKINEAINIFLHPVLGGPDGKGWEIGQDITISSLLDHIKLRSELSSDIGFISSIGINPKDPLYSPPERPPTFPIVGTPSVWVKLADYEIICSAESHAITFTIS